MQLAGRDGGTALVEYYRLRSARCDDTGFTRVILRLQTCGSYCDYLIQAGRFLTSSRKPPPDKICDRQSSPLHHCAALRPGAGLRLSSAARSRMGLLSDAPAPIGLRTPLNKFLAMAGASDAYLEYRRTSLRPFCLRRDREKFKSFRALG